MIMFHIKGELKINDHSVKHMFVVYESSSKGYKLHNPSNNKVVVSRNVEFDQKAT